jgi:Polysaccharide lyase
VSQQPVARRSVLSTLGLAAAGAPLLRLPDPTVQNVLWTADPARGTGVFDGLEQDPGRISVGDDPQGRFGRCFKYEIWDLSGSKERCESRGMRGTDGRPLRIGTGQEGRTFYFGWRSLWSPLPIASGRWTALYQLHVSGVSSPEVNVGPFVLRTLGDGRLYFQHISPNGSDRHIWSTSLRIGTWQRFAIGFLLSRSGSGWVEFWYDGVQQRFSNGQTRFPGQTLWGSHVNTKWGIYRSGPNNGRGTAYLNSARLGTSYADVAL